VFTLGTNLAFADNRINVKINEFYKPGDTVKITGTAGTSEVINIKIYNSIRLILNENTTSNSLGEFSYSFNLTNYKLDIYELVITSSSNQITSSFKVSNINQERITEYLISLIKNSKEKIEFLLIEVKIQGIENPENAIEYYEEGLVKMAEAQSLLNENDFSGAIESSQEALYIFQEVFKMIYSDINFKELEIDKISQLENSILQEIEQTENQYDKLRKTYDRIQVLGFRTPKLEELMKEAAQHIEITKTYLRNKKFQDSREELQNAKMKLRTIEQLLKQNSFRVKQILLERYRNYFTIRLVQMKEIIRKLSLILHEDQVNQLTNKIEILQNRLIQIQIKIINGQLEEALRDLETTQKELQNNITQLNGIYNSMTLKEIDFLIAKVQSLNATLTQQKTEGLETSSIEQRLNDAQKRLESLENHFDSIKDSTKEISSNTSTSIKNE
jgi:hypothetical protein